MALAGDLIDDILLRVRDTNASGTSRSDVLDLIDRCQVLVARETGALIQERTVTGKADTLIYEVDTNVTLRIIDVFVGDKRLSAIRWPGFALIDRGWWRDTHEDGPDSWAPIGTNYFLIHPGFDAVGTDLTVREQRRPTFLSSENLEIEIPSEHQPRLLDLVEALLYLRHRDTALASVLERMNPNAQG